MLHVPFDAIFSLPVDTEAELAPENSADFPTPAGRCAVVTDVYAENLGGAEALLTLAVASLGGNDVRRYMFRVPAGGKLELHYSTGLRLGGPVPITSITVLNDSRSSTNATVRFRINGFYVDAPIQVVFDSPMASGDGPESTVRPTFLAVGRASGNSSPLTPRSRAVLYKSVNAGPVGNGVGKWTTPPPGSDWAFQFTDVAPPFVEPPLNISERYNLVVNLMDDDGHIGTDQIRIIVGQQ